MASAIDAGQIAGAVTLVARHEQIVQLTAHGQLDLASQRPMPVDALFRLASMTKPIVAVAIMQLFEAGQAAPRRSGRALPAHLRRPAGRRCRGRLPAGPRGSPDHDPRSADAYLGPRERDRRAGRRGNVAAPAPAPARQHAGRRHSDDSPIPAELPTGDDLGIFAGLRLRHARPHCRDRRRPDAGPVFPRPDLRAAGDVRHDVRSRPRPGVAAGHAVHVDALRVGAGPARRWTHALDDPGQPVLVWRRRAGRLRDRLRAVRPGARERWADCCDVRVLSRRAVDLLASNHIGDLALDRAPPSMRGHRFGLGVRVLDSPAEAGQLASRGSFGWAVRSGPTAGSTR